MQLPLRKNKKYNMSLPVLLLSVFAFLGLLNSCVSSSESEDLTGIYSAKAFRDEPFTRKDSLELSDSRFIHNKRYFDDKGILIYLKRHWGYYKVESDSLRFMDIGRDSVYDSKGVDLNYHIDSISINGDKVWHSMAYKKIDSGFTFQDSVNGSPIWIECTRN